MASSEKFVKRAHERGQLTLEDVGISVELERDPDWSINGRYSGSDMKRAFEAGRTLKPEDDPTEILEDLSLANCYFG